MKNRRREFIKGISGIGLGIFSLNDLTAKMNQNTHRRSKKIGEVCVFSKHLQFLDYDEMADAAAEMGFDGVDLTVRPGGHVLPENVERDLPRAVKAVEKAGLRVPMMASGINDPKHTLTEKVLATAAESGIGHYRMDYYHYDYDKGIMESLREPKKMVEGLNKLNEKYRIVGNYQNHAGTYVGAPVWDLWEIFRDLSPEWIGCQYDIRHATVEGGNSWPIGLQLIRQYISTLVIKDFKWGMEKDRWQTINTPLGDGMVPFDSFFEKAKSFGIGGPVTIHFEYPLAANPPEQMDKKSARKQVTGLMQKDLHVLKSMLKKAGLI